MAVADATVGVNVLGYAQLLGSPILGLVQAVAQHPREPQGDPAGIPRRALEPVERDLDDMLGALVDDVDLTADLRAA